MTKVDAFTKAKQISARKQTTRYVVYDGEDFGADAFGQGGYQIAADKDLDGFYNGCTIEAAFTNGHFEE